MFRLFLQSSDLLLVDHTAIVVDLILLLLLMKITTHGQSLDRK